MLLNYSGLHVCVRSLVWVVMTTYYLQMLFHLESLLSRICDHHESKSLSNFGNQLTCCYVYQSRISLDCRDEHMIMTMQ